MNLLINKTFLKFWRFCLSCYKNMLLKQLLGDKLMLQAYLKNVGKGLDRKMVTQNMAKEESM